MTFPNGSLWMFIMAMAIRAIGFKTYGADPEYQKCFTAVPVLFAG